MNGTARETRRRWQPMKLTRVGDVSAVMQQKSGPQCDPSPITLRKRGLGPPPTNC